jgi:hypothetical protein
MQYGAYAQAIEILNGLNKDVLKLDLAVASLENGEREGVFNYWQEVAKADDEFLSTTAKEILATVFTKEPDLNTERKIYLYARYNRFYLDESAMNQLLNKIDNDYLRIGLALDMASFYHEQDNQRGAIQMLRNIETLAFNKEQFRQYLILNALINQESDFVQRKLIVFDSLYTFREDEYLIENTLNHLAGMQLDSLAYLQMATDNPFISDAVLIGAASFDDKNNSFKSYELLAQAVQKNPESQRILQAYILKALDVGFDQFAENAMYQFRQKFSGQAYLLMKSEYDKKVMEMNTLLELEPIE